MFEDIGLLFFTVLMLSLLFTPLSVLLSHRIGAIDHPVGRSVHSKPMPRLGGLGMAFAVLVGMAIFLRFEPIFVAFMVGASLVIITGVADDIYQIPPLFKMLGQILGCVLFIELGGLQIISLGDIFGLGEVAFAGSLSYVFTVFCMVGIINAFNLSDGLDGLAAGIVVVICFFLGFLALQAHAWAGLTIVVVVLGAVLGFLKFNSYPARLFMGDTGSLMLGFSMASLAVILIAGESKGIRPISIAVILAMPIVDTVWVMVRRIMQGKSPVRPDKTHLHHRLLALGLPHALVVIVLYVWVAMFGILDLVMQGMPDYWLLYAAVSLSLLFYCMLTLCEHKNIAGLFAGEKDVKEFIVYWLGLSLKILPYIIVLGLCLPILFVDTIPEKLSTLTLGLGIFVAVAFPWKNDQEYTSIIHGLFYLCGFVILYVWNAASYQAFNPHYYIFLFGGALLVWSFLKIKFKSNKKVFLTSSFEVLLIFMSWFIPYVMLPILEVSEAVLESAKLSCLGAVPLFIAMKLVIKRKPHRNRKMVISLLVILLLISLKSFVG